MSQRAVSVLALLHAVLVLAACGTTGDNEPEVFIGALGEGDVLAATIWDDDAVIFYSCGSGDSLATTTSWFAAARTADAPNDVEAGLAPFTLVATRDADMVRGTLTDASRTLDVDLRRQTRADVAGVFNLVVDGCRTAAIAYERAGAMVVQGAHFCSPEGPFYQVTPFAPGEPLGATLRVSFDDGTGGRTITLPRQ